MVRLGQNFLADPNLLEAIVRESGLEANDVVLEVGGGEGVLTERLAAEVATLHVIELDERLRPGLEELAAREPVVRPVFGDAMDVDLAALEPAPTAMVANLPYSIATPVILRTIAVLLGLGRWTVMVQREIADQGIRVAERPGPARLPGGAAARGGPGRFPPAAPGGVRIAAPRADGAVARR